MSGIIDTVGSKSGIVGSDVYPAGHVIQVKTQVMTSYIGGTATSEIASGPTLSITRTTGTNLIITYAPAQFDGVNDGHYYVQLFNTTTGVRLSDGWHHYHFDQYNSEWEAGYGGITAVDAVTTQSGANNYQCKYYTNGTVGYLFNSTTHKGWITAIEYMV